MTDLIRAWDKKNKMWIEDFVILKNGRVCKLITEGEKSTTFLGEVYKEAVANSFIGMCDAKKDPIFEDDIVQISINEGDETTRKIVGVIKAVSPSFVVATREGIIPIDYGLILRVIGNTWEHPERFYQTPVLCH